MQICCLPLTVSFPTTVLKPSNPRHNPKNNVMTSTELANKIGQFALDKKALEVKILDLRALDAVCDYFVICSGEVELQVKAIVDYIYDSLAMEKVKPYHREGYENLQWVLLDYVDVVVHVMLPDRRSFYSLESLWIDADIRDLIEESPSSRMQDEK
jgi:ribosome-associated protein